MKFQLQGSYKNRLFFYAGFYCSTRVLKRTNCNQTCYGVPYCCFPTNDDRWRLLDCCVAIHCKVVYWNLVE